MSRINDATFDNDLLHNYENKYMNSINNLLSFEEFLSKYENLWRILRMMLFVM